MNWITLRDAEKKYKIKATTIRGYIFRKKYLAKNQYKKIGNTWIISEQWVKSRYEERKKEDE